MDTDAVVVGSGPNGLAAGIRLAQEGHSVLILEANETVGGGIRSDELTLASFTHDICSAIHPFGPASSFIGSLPLDEHGLEWVWPTSQLAHPLDGGEAVIVERSVSETAAALGPDEATYRGLFEPLVRDWDALVEQFFGPLRPPRHPLAAARFGLTALRSVTSVARGRFEGPQARAVFAGMGSHSILPLEKPMTASFGMMLGASAHALGWPFPKGGAQSLADAMASLFRALGGKIECGNKIESFEEIPRAKVVLFDLTPRQVIEIAGTRFPSGYRRRLDKFRYGPGVFKLDLALEGPIPWAASKVARSATVHVGGTLEEIAASERAPWEGRHAERPFIILAQPTLFDDTRAPSGKHTVWAYCHVPSGSTVDMTEAIEGQIERFAPGFRDLIIGRHTFNTHELQAHNPNYIGGDIGSGSHGGLQTLARPVLAYDPYKTSADGIYICSASTPPGGGIHGMCGYHAANSALSYLRKR